MLHPLDPNTRNPSVGATIWRAILRPLFPLRSTVRLTSTLRCLPRQCHFLSSLAACALPCGSAGFLQDDLVLSQNADHVKLWQREP